jgi:general secretion pathway protein H
MRGFTLLELMVVIAVIALLAVLLAMRGPPRSARLELDATASALVSELRSARSRAIADRRAAVVEIDPEKRLWHGPEEAAHALPERVSVAVEAAAGIPNASPVGTIRFEPDGSASGRLIRLAAGKRVVEISVSWLTGEVRVRHAA